MKDQPRPKEAAAPEPIEPTAMGPDEVCGVNGCQTRWTDPEVMRRHKQRVHGIGAPQNRNQPRGRESVESKSEQAHYV